MIASVSNQMPSVSWLTCLTLFAGGVGSLPSPADHHSPLTTLSQVAAGPSRLRLHAAGCSATATRPVRTSRKRTYSDSLGRAASRSLTPPSQVIGYKRKRVSSFNQRWAVQRRNVSLLVYKLSNASSPPRLSATCIVMECSVKDTECTY